MSGEERGGLVAMWGVEMRWGLVLWVGGWCVGYGGRGEDGGGLRYPHHLLQHAHHGILIPARPRPRPRPGSHPRRLIPTLTPKHPPHLRRIVVKAGQPGPRRRVRLLADVDFGRVVRGRERRGEGWSCGGAPSSVLRRWGEEMGEWVRGITRVGGAAGQLGDFVEAGGAAGFDLGFAAVAPEAGLVRRGGRVGRDRWGGGRRCGGEGGAVEFFLVGEEERMLGGIARL